jgi:CBS domain-containing protein
MPGAIDCREVMTKELIVCRPSDSVAHAAELMAKYHVGALPVVDSEEHRRLEGIVTDRDLALRVVAHGHDPRRVTVADVMTREVLTCAPEQDIGDAIDLMADRQLRRIPIVEDGRLVGIVAQADIANRSLDRERTMSMLQEISQPEAKR